jgi:hypothetical protein
MHKGHERSLPDADDERPAAASTLRVLHADQPISGPTIHVYSPPLETMGQFEVSDGSRLRMMRREIVDVDTFATG